MLYLFVRTENTNPVTPWQFEYLPYGTNFCDWPLGLNFFITSQGFFHLGMAYRDYRAWYNIYLDPILSSA